VFSHSLPLFVLARRDSDRGNEGEFPAGARGSREARIQWPVGSTRSNGLETLISPTLREMALVAAMASALVLAAANYLANHAVQKRLPRLAYTVLVVLVCGTLLPAAALRGLTGSGILQSSVLAWEPLALAAAIIGGGVLLAAFLRSQPGAEWRRVPVLVVALLGPSLAEVLVFAGLIYTVAEYALAAQLSRWLAAAAAAIVSAAAFALYHLTHGPPWNEWRLIRTLFLVWLLVAATYVWTVNLWAAAAINTCMATIGFIKGRVTRAEEQPLVVSAALDAAAVLAVVAIAAAAAG